MNTILIALLPIFLLIALGYALKRLEFPNREFWDSADKFTYYVLFPSLLIYKLATANLEGFEGFSFVSSAIITMVIVTVVLMILNYFAFLFDGASFTSVYQGAIRFNTYVFLAMVDALYGDTGLVMAALLITFMIPLINIFCITIFALYVNESKINTLSVINSIIKNPLILACIVGGGLNYFGIPLGVSLEKTLGILSSAALPLGLLSVGVGLHLSQIKEAKMELFSSLFFKLAIYPAMILGIGMALEVNTMALQILILFGAMPTAPSSYILSKQLGGNVSLMSSIITVQILVSMVTISFLLQIINS